MSVDEYILELRSLIENPRPRDVVGGKASYLARLLAAGLPVPPGVVLTSAARDLDDEHKDRLFAALRTRIEPLGPVLAVRSSAALEDDIAAAAPGVFASVLHVSRDGLEDAVTRVWASSEMKLVREYARLRGVDDLSVAVIVQRQVPDAAAGDIFSGTLYTRVPGRSESREMVIEIRSYPGDDQASAVPHTVRVHRKPDESGAGPESGVAPLSPLLVQALRRAALEAERAIHASSGADVEWVARGHDELWLVQARPIVHPGAQAAASSDAQGGATENPALPPVFLAFSRLEPDRVWHWDAAHNPDPLSPAQTGLVERLDEASVAPYRMRVVGGYLYHASETDAPAATERDPTAPDPTRDATSLREFFDQVIAPEMDAALAPGMSSDVSLSEALAAYQEFYAIYARRLGPVISRGKRALTDFLRAHASTRADADADALAFRLTVPDEPAGVDGILQRAASGRISRAELEAELGDMAATWDVACATLSERPALIDRALRSAAECSEQRAQAHRRALSEARELNDEVTRELARRSSRDEVDEFQRLVAVARVAFTIAERDDIHFARAQACVRRALLALARRWRLEPAQHIFYLPLDTVLVWAEDDHPPDPVGLERLARAGRTALERQRAWRPPEAFANGAPLSPGDATPSERPGPRTSWRGQGIGPRVQGICIRVADLTDAPPDVRGAIVITRTVTPAMAVWFRDAAAVVAERGGLLDHGAAMARELDIPCVVGCRGIWSQVRPGEHLEVDGDAGRVSRVSPSSPQ